MFKSKAGIDWVAAKQEYATSDMSLKEIAAKHGCHHKAVERRSALDGWAQARGSFRDEVGRRAQALQSESRAHKLKEWNDADLKIARVLRSRVANRLNKLAQTPDIEDDLTELRTLAGVVESTQRIGRLALGATTDNQGSIFEPGEDGIATPKLGDFYSTIKFEGPTEPAPKKPEDDEPTKH
jgi:hypothetical protein